MTRREVKRIETDLDRVAARVEKELAASGIDAVKAELKASIRRARNRFRMRLVRSGEWAAVKALRGLSASKLEAMLSEKLLTGSPGTPGSPRLIPRACGGKSAHSAGPLAAGSSRGATCSAGRTRRPEVGAAPEFAKPGPPGVHVGAQRRGPKGAGKGGRDDGKKPPGWADVGHGAQMTAKGASSSRGRAKIANSANRRRR